MAAQRVIDKVAEAYGIEIAVAVTEAFTDTWELVAQHGLTEPLASWLTRTGPPGCRVG